MERSGNKFEKAWRDLFEEAEVQPREEVWTKIDSTLANQQIRKYRRKILVYKLLAAASILFAIGIGYFNILENSGPQENNNSLSVVDNLAERGSGFQDESSPGFGNELIQENEAVAAQRSAMAGKKGNENREHGFPGKKMPDTDPGLLKEDYTDRDNEIRSLPYLANRLNIETDPPSFDITDPKKKRDPFADDWYALYEKIRIMDEEEDHRNDLWAGVNFSSGVFNPNISYGDNSVSFANQALSPTGTSYDQLSTVPDPSNNIANYMKATQPEESSYNPEFSYAYGVNIGYQINRKFMVRGGLSYLSNHTSTNINSYINNPVTNKKMPNQALYSVSIESAGVTSVNTATEEIQLNNTYEFISLPLSFGYYLIDKKIEWMLTAGVTTDFFLKNTISDPSNFLESKEITAGSDSPYNNSYFNGTLGTMVNVSFADHYRFSLEPTYRLGLSDFAKDEAIFTSRPSTFFITAGLSYIFK